mmetsp:Transcript_63946/g.166169  ORF Transcript_63946/g.166169 Transcript_63946/m.166169 type:complete len:375 (+) Transcript_63946:70-1194(+)
MGFVVKMSVGTDIRRRRFEDASEVSFEVIADMVRENFGFTSFSATYRDDEGDVCSLTSLTLPDAVSLSGGSLRLEIQEVVQSAGSTASRWTAGVEPCEGLSGHSPLDNVTSFSIGTPVPSSSPCNSISSSIRDTWLLEEGGPQHQADSDSGTLLGNSDSNSTWDGVEPSDSATRIAHQAETMLNLSDDEIQDERVGATSHDDVVPAEEETSPIPPPSAPPQEQTPEEQHEEGSITDSEKVLIILAAFDADGDGRLSFREANALQQAAWGGRVSWRSFARVCADVGVSARQGLGPAELAELYVRFGTLERDFLLALERLQGGSQRQGRKATSSTTSFRGPSCLLPLLALPVAVRCPLLGVPLVVLAASRCRQQRA